MRNKTIFVLLTIYLEVYVDELIVKVDISAGCVAIELFICNIGLWAISFLNCFPYFGTYFVQKTYGYIISKTQD